jgi:hypothetical protein
MIFVSCVSALKVAGGKSHKQKNPDGYRVGVRFLYSMVIDSEQAPRGIAAGKPEITKKAGGLVRHCAGKYYGMIG